MAQHPPNDPPVDDGGVDVLTKAYRHDVHKFLGTSHENAPQLFAGVAANESVPLGADGDAARLSRPGGQPTPTVDNHATHHRLSLVDGRSLYDPDSFARDRLKHALGGLFTESDPEALHEAWLTSGVASAFTESVYYPSTSLKYHTLLVAALLDNYRRGYEIGDLSLVVDSPHVNVPPRAVYARDRFTLRITAEPADRPSARLGATPWQSWATTWCRLTDYALDTAHDKYDMVLAANLRRIGAGSTALQYIEDFLE